MELLLKVFHIIASSSLIGLAVIVTGVLVCSSVSWSSCWYLKGTLCEREMPQLRYATSSFR